MAELETNVDITEENREKFEEMYGVIPDVLSESSDVNEISE